MSVSTRLVSLDDLPALLDLLRANREFLAPWEPERTADFFTAEVQRASLENSLGLYEGDRLVPHVILDGDRIVGRITLSNVVRGPFQSANLGYWVSAADNGRGIASAAVRAVTRLAFGELGLHRIEAGTLLHNVGSQRVLERNGFVRIGVAPRYLKIAGEYQDHILFQLLADEGAATR